MPYQKRADLPESVRSHVPKHGQEIYKEAFNSAYEHYKSPDNRNDDVSREETAHKVAWSAVGKSYHKGDDGNWEKNQ